jgi:hypothetical protein
MNKFILLLSALLIGFFAHAQNACTPTLPYTVKDGSGLKMRKGPGANFPVVAFVPAKSELLLCEELFAAATFEGINGHWRAVRYKDKMGYMFDGFLVPGSVAQMDAYTFKMAQLDVVNSLIQQNPKRIDSLLTYLNHIARILGYEKLIGMPKKDVDSIFMYQQQTPPKEIEPATVAQEPDPEPIKPEPVVVINYNLLTETANYCGDIQGIDPGLIWYAVYRRGDYFYRTRTDVMVLKSKYALRKGLEFDVRADTDKEVAFMFSSPKVLDTNWAVYQPFDYFVTHPNKLFPGQQIELFAKAPVEHVHNVYLSATGAVLEVGLCPVLEKYKMKATAERDGYAIEQDITPLFSYMGQCGQPEIYWFGDMNNDLYPDIIFVAVGDKGTLFTLLMSDAQGTTTLYRKAAEWFNQTCE